MSPSPLTSLAKTGEGNTKRCEYCQKPLAQGRLARVLLKRSSATKDPKFCSNACVVARQKEKAQLWREEMTRVCEVCEQPFHPRSDEGKVAFSSRKCCSNTCANKLERKRGGRRVEVVEVKKKCAVCGTEFGRRDDEAIQNFKKRKSCSPHCGGILRGNGQRGVRVEPTERKTCPNCKKEFTRKRFGVKGVLENPAAFKKRKFCSHACAMSAYQGTAKAMRQPRPDLSQLYIDKPVTVAEVMAKILKEKEDLRITEGVGGATCRTCGIAEVSPFTGNCSACTAKAIWAKSQRERGATPRMSPKH